MTVFVCERPWTTPAGERFNLWADTSDEAVAALYAIGGDETQRREECNSWEAYAITAEQFADAVGLGVTITDPSGPAHWCATRDGNTRLLRIIDKAREVARVRRAPPPPR